MLMKTKIALAAAIMLGTASVAMANDDSPGESTGFRELGSGATVKQGVNPVDHPSLSGAPRQAPKSVIQTEGRAPANAAGKKDSGESVDENKE
jgi:hypothetical protein